MPRRRTRGDRAFRKMLRRLPDTAREEMADVLDGAGGELVAAIKADTPVLTGALRRGISKKLSRRTLKLQVGLVGRPINRKLFYGRIVEFGRKAKTVMVQRRRAGANNGYRGGRKRAEDIATTYRMRIKARAPHPFIYKRRDLLRNAIADRIKAFWNNTLTSAAAGADFND